MRWFRDLVSKIARDDIAFFAGAFSYFMFFSTAALALFIFLLFGESVSFSIVNYLSPDYEALLKPIITSLSISSKWSWILLIPLAWGSTNIFASLEHAASIIAGRRRRSTVVIRLLSFALVLLLAFAVWGYTIFSGFFAIIPSWFYNFLFYSVFFVGFNFFLDGHFKWRDAIVVGVVQAAIWQIASVIVTYYIKQVSTSIVFKIASSIPVVLFWYYILAYVIMLGWEVLASLNNNSIKKV
ncbi:YhjD/YihY/BrkB family envelope integrity protein [Coprothermobacter platensis]|jgi:membrane protein|uniref:YhjD/YihY/BrkB family envelope integrity protein n=1 Tax=Coprothermobacter platensis TaxID=108819 RepID=UPI00036453BD|nr:YhjD/YihY/BrkB family envelope integrity protein [Coprothermobacter platensis]